MSKSLEALENLVHCKSETKCKECKHKYRCTMERDYHTIKQDLERKEELLKENQELKELQELNKQGLWNLKQENNKLKKAIEILKDKPYVLTIGLENFWWNELEQRYEYIEDIINEDMYGEATLHIETYELTKQEYELLKEVLE